MTAMELIETYNISLCERLEWGKGLVPDGRIKVGSLAKAQKDGAIDMIKTKKPEIMSVLLARRMPGSRLRPSGRPASMPFPAGGNPGG